MQQIRNNVKMYFSKETMYETELDYSIHYSYTQADRISLTFCWFSENKNK